MLMVRQTYTKKAEILQNNDTNNTININEIKYTFRIQSNSRSQRMLSENYHDYSILPARLWVPFRNFVESILISHFNWVQSWQKLI